MYIAGLYAGAD